MHRGNPSLTGVVQASGLRHFQQVKWELEGQFAVHIPLVAGSDLLYALWLTDGQTEIRAIEKETGTVSWQWKPGQDEYAGQSHLYLDQGVLYYPVHSVQTQPGTHMASLKGSFLYAFDTQTGRVLRRIPIPSLGNRLNCNLFAMHEGVAYLNGMDSAPASNGAAHYSCAAVDLQTEKLLWMADLGVRLYSTSPVVAHGMVYLQTYDSARGHQSLMHLHALSARTGEPTWEYECERGLVREFAVAGTDIFLLGNGGLEVIDTISGTRKWNLPSRQSALNGPPTITNKFVYLSYEGFPTWIEEERRQTGAMVVLERASRQEQWSAKANEGQYATDGAIVADEVLYTLWEHIGFAGEGVTNATLFALDLRTGQEYWHFNATELSVPLVTDGNVFLVRGEGEGRSTYLCALT
ncbi:MAG TPA: PQQ-binding-like beta-propeller repeat protein [Ktedonobacteraceae bacterium]